MRQLCLIFVCLKFGTSFSQLSGTAQLSGQTTYAGIKVKFSASGGTAVTDSTFTSASGAFSINITGGLYTVTYSFPGYQTIFLNNNSPVLLSNTVTLSSATLVPGNVVPVSGSVSGNWTNNNIYLVNGNLNIASGTTLSIAPGTQVKFNGNYSLTVQGSLLATGTPGNHILFTSNFSPKTPGDWYGIRIAGGSSTISNCTMEYGQTMIWVEPGQVTITDNEFRKFTRGAVTLNAAGTTLVRNNIMHDFQYGQASYGINTYASSGVFECNTIYNGQTSGMVIGDNSLAINNVIYDMGLDGISVYGFSGARLENNVISQCKQAGVGVGETVGTGPTPLIVNNTLYHNGVGVLSHKIFSRPSVINNVIVSNTIGISQVQSFCGSCSTTPSLVTNNLVWNNGTNYSQVQIASIGVSITTNSNGHNIDSYFNLSQDPVFANNTPPALSASSPCFNAGNTVYSPHIGANLAYLCQGMVTGLPSHVRIKDISVFPNPFQNGFIIRNSSEKKISHLSLYNVYGTLVKQEQADLSSDELRLTCTDLSPGTYLLSVSFADGSTGTSRLVKTE